MKSALEFSTIGTLDELLERAASGARAGHALDIVKEELTSIRNSAYVELLNSTDAKQQAELIADLRAVEKLAKILLVREAQGDVAYQRLMASGAVPAQDPAPLSVPKVVRTRSSRTPKAAATPASTPSA